jgi:tetratricopeptide (TPR) repeat protein
MLAEGQDRFADSLELVLATAPLDTNRVNLLNTLTFRLKYSDPERALRHADEAENLAKQLAYRKGLAATYYCRAYVTQIAGDYPRAVKLVQQSLDIARDDSDLYRQAYCHGLLGIIYGRWTDHDKAVRHNLLAGELFRLLGDTLTLAAIQTNIGTLYEERGVYDSALVHYFKSLEYKRAKGRHGAAVVELANIGASYRMLGEHELALDYNWQGIVQSMKSPERPILDHFYANRGEVYLDLGRLDSATHYAQAAYEIAKGRNQPYHRLPTLKLLGEVNLKTGKTNAATRFFQEGFTLAVDIGNLDYQAILGCELGGLYLAQGQVDESSKSIARAGRKTITSISNAPPIDWPTLTNRPASFIWRYTITSSIMLTATAWRAPKSENTCWSSNASIEPKRKRANWRKKTSRWPANKRARAPSPSKD